MEPTPRASAIRAAAAVQREVNVPPLPANIGHPLSLAFEYVEVGSAVSRVLTLLFISFNALA